MITTTLWTSTRVSYRNRIRVFHDDVYGDHLQTFHTQSVTQTTHDWVVYSLSSLMGSVGYRVKIRKITPPIGNERDDIEMKDFLVTSLTSGTGELPTSSPTDSGLFDDTTVSGDTPEPHWETHTHTSLRRRSPPRCGSLMNTNRPKVLYLYRRLLSWG